MLPAERDDLGQQIIFNRRWLTVLAHSRTAMERMRSDDDRG
jgi:hypothetical protein